MSSDSSYITQEQYDNEEILFDSGGTADCYRLVKDNRIYCVKRPKPQYRNSEAYIHLFHKEFEMGIELEHPNIVRYFTYDGDEKGPFIRMDYVDGDSLEEFLAKHPGYFDQKEHRKQFCNELFSAMAYIHDKGILHLDLKPRNILITTKGHHIKLIDLGFGWSESHLHDLGRTLDYCAPEQLAAKTDLISPATDIFAMGKILQQFGLANDSIVKRCLKENPKERYQSVSELKKAIQRCETAKTTSIIGLGLAATLFIGAIMWLVHNREEPLPPRHAAPAGAINGLFTINEAGDQVYFSKGNLQYIGNADVPYWKFAENPWECLGNNGQGRPVPNVNRDLFGWGTSGYDHGAVCYEPWAISMDSCDYHAYGVDTCNLFDGDGRADWGFNAISNGGNEESLWRTLTSEEWIYVFRLRSTPSGIRCSKGIVNNIGGIILLPDDWDESYYTLDALNGGGYFGSNTITKEEWATHLEAHGAVFLPTTWGIFENPKDTVVNEEYGYYWSSSRYNDGIGTLDFNSFLLYPDKHTNRKVSSVRLVRDKK